MEPKEQLAEVMKNTSLIALASSVEDLPNARILDIFFDEKQNVVVFPTSALSPKVKEFEANDTVAFTTIPRRPWTGGSCAECHRLEERLGDR